MSQRDPGFYWVRQYGEWEVAKFDGDCWHFAWQTEDGYQTGHYHTPDTDDDLEEIDERRIVREE